MFKHMLWGAVAFWLMQAFLLAGLSHAGIITWDENRVIARFIVGYECLATIGIGVIVVISGLAWPGIQWLVARITRGILVASSLAGVLAIVSAQAASADLLRTQTIRAVVTAVESDSITVQGRTVQGDSVHTFPASLLAVSLVNGDSVALEVVIGEEFGRWNGLILEAWKMLVDVEYVHGTIHAKLGNYWQPADTSMYEIHIDELGTDIRYPFRLATDARPGDTVMVRNYVSLLLRTVPGQDGVVVREDSLHQRRPEIIDHRPYNRK